MINPNQILTPNIAILITAAPIPPLDSPTQEFYLNYITITPNINPNIMHAVRYVTHLQPI
jgi:hypothetical protein